MFLLREVVVVMVLTILLSLWPVNYLLSNVFVDEDSIIAISYRIKSIKSRFVGC